MEWSPRKVLEVPKSPWIKGASIPWPILHLQLYILMGNPIFEGGQPLSRNSSPLAAAKEAEELIYITSITKEEEGARGPYPQGLPAPPPPSGRLTPGRRLFHAGRRGHGGLHLHHHGPSSSSTSSAPSPSTICISWQT